jgi:hypothetical protein
MTVIVSWSSAPVPRQRFTPPHSPYRAERNTSLLTVDLHVRWHCPPLHHVEHPPGEDCCHQGEPEVENHQGGMDPAATVVFVCRPRGLVSDTGRLCRCPHDTGTNCHKGRTSTSMSRPLSVGLGPPGPCLATGSRMRSTPRVGWLRLLSSLLA